LTINAEAGSTVQVFDGANLLGQATEGANGVFTFTTASLSETAYAFTAKATDGAGNVSDASVAVSVTVDTTVATPSAQLSKDTGSSASDLVTSDASMSFSTPAADVIRTFAVDGGAASDAYVAPTSNGAHTVVVTDTDTAGNVATATVSFTMDTQAAAPVVALATNSGDTTDSITNSAALTTPTGVEPGAKVEYSIDGGDWSETYAAPTSDGTYSVAVRQTDVAGNISASTTVEFTRDTTGPTVTSLSPTDGGKSLGLAANLVVTASEALAKGTGTITLAEADGTVIETFDVATSNRLTVNGNQVIIDPTDDLVKDQAYKVTATGKVVTDLAGNDFTDVGGNDGWQFTGAGASVTIDNVTGDDLVNKAEWEVANASTHTIVVTGTVTAEAAILEAFTKEDLSGSVTGPNGPGAVSGFTYSYTSGTTATWSGKIPASMFMGEGSLGLSISILGTTGAAAAVAGAATSSVAFDTVVLAPSVSLQADTGVSNTDGVTSNGSVSVTGKETGAQVEYSIDGTTWTSTFTAVEGPNSVQVRQTDAAGNVSGASTPLTFTLDSAAPGTPVIQSVTDDSGIAADRKTNDTMPVIVVKAESATVIKVGTAPESPITSAYSVIESANGDGTSNYTVTFTEALGNGGYGFASIDAAGNKSASTGAGVDGPNKFKIDNTAPSTPEILSITENSGNSSDRRTSDSTPLVVIKAESGTSIKVGQNNTEISTAYSVDETTNGDGTSNYTVTFTEALGEGGYGFASIDGAGNKSASTESGVDGPNKFAIDTSAPATPQIISITDNSGNATDRLTNDTMPVIVVKAESATVIKVGTAPDSPITSAYSVAESTNGDGTSNYTVTFTEALGDGGYGFASIDAAGNKSASTGAGVDGPNKFKVDNTAPALSIETPVGNDFTFQFKFDGPVNGFDASDVVATNGVVGTGSVIDAATGSYTVVVTPSPSIVPVDFSINVAAGAATDAAGNASTADAFTKWVMIGTSANEVLTLSGGHDVFVDLKAGGNDTVKIADASELVSTTGGRDVIEGFGLGDKIDLSAIIRGAGYSSLSGGVADSPVVFKNAAILNQYDVYSDESLLLDNVAKVDVYANTSNYYVPTDGIKMDFVLSGVVTDYWMTSAKFTSAPNYDDAITSLSGLVAGAGSQTIAAGAKIGTVYFQLVAGATDFTFALEALELNAGPETKLPSTVSTDPSAKALTIVVDDGALTAVADNQLHILAAYNDLGGVTHVTMQFDTNSSVGATSLSDILHLEFDGNITASLTPQSIIPL
jgi:large repetitive protein